MKRILRLLHQLLLAIAARLGKINGFILMALSFYLVLLPTGLLWRIFSGRDTASGWKPRPPSRRNHFEKQF